MRNKSLLIGKIDNFVNRKSVNVLFPAIAGIYYLILDVWGSTWSWVSNNEVVHQALFIAVASFSFAVIVFKTYYSEQCKINDVKEANGLLNEFIGTISTVVEAKCLRFKQKLGDIHDISDKFNYITQPEEQLRIISSTTSRFICHAFGVDEDGFDLTIMHRDNVESNWRFIYKHQDWKLTNPNDLIQSGRSTAHFCFDRQEYKFHPSKESAASRGEYVMSERDRTRGIGSIFVYPVRLKVQDENEHYIISISTYGAQLCDEEDKDSIEFTKGVLKEFCRRIQLELTLYTIKKV